MRGPRAGGLTGAPRPRFADPIFFFFFGNQKRQLDEKTSMFGTLAKKIFGSANDRRIKAYRPRVEAINALEPELEALSDDDLRPGPPCSANSSPKAQSSTTCSFRPSLPCAKARGACSASGISDVQLVGGMVLHEGDIAEMKTGEGKTLVATLPVYLNALTGRGVHVVTVKRLSRTPRHASGWGRSIDSSACPSA